MPVRCPCGDGLYAECCGPLHAGRGSGRVTAATAEQLMRSRYSAFAVGDVAYLLLTWHPTTRPASLALDPDVEWRRLEILGATDDTVEFVAHFWHTGHLQRGQQREHSAFVREDGQWFYRGTAAT